MSRAKNKRKSRMRRRRERERKQGKNVPFSLSNYPKKLVGISNKYQYKINVHNCNFSEAQFSRVRYRSGHITYSNFKNAEFNNVDFINVNLNRSKFKYVTFNNCIFFACNLQDVNLERAIYKNNYFIKCNLKKSLNFHKTSGVYIINRIPSLNLSSDLINILHKMGRISKLEKYRILLVNSKKINLWMLDILFNQFTEYEVKYFFKKILKTNKTQIYTLHDYHLALKKYYKR